MLDDRGPRHINHSLYAITAISGQVWRRGASRCPAQANKCNLDQNRRLPTRTSSPTTKRRVFFARDPWTQPGALVLATETTPVKVHARTIGVLEPAAMCVRDMPSVRFGKAKEH